MTNRAKKHTKNTCIKKICRYLRCLLPVRCKNGIINQTDDQFNHNNNTKEIIPIEIIETFSDVNISPISCQRDLDQQKYITSEGIQADCSISNQSVSENNSWFDSSSDEEDDKIRVRRLSFFIDNEYIRNSKNMEDQIDLETTVAQNLKDKEINNIDSNISDIESDIESDVELDVELDVESDAKLDKESDAKLDIETDTHSETIVNTEVQLHYEHETKVKQD